MGRFKRMLIALGREPLDETLLKAALRIARRTGIEQVQSLNILKGPRLDVLLRHVVDQEIDLVVLGHHRGGRITALARRLARKCPCAVLMIPEAPQHPEGPVAVAVDFSEDSAVALDAGLELAEALSAPECLVTNVYASGGGETGEARVVQRDETEEFGRFLAGHDTHGVRVRSVFEDAGDVATGLDRVVAREGVSLLVMGSRGRSQATGILLGSAVEDAMDRLLCPVLIVRAPGRVRTLGETLLRRALTDADRPRLG